MHFAHSFRPAARLCHTPPHAIRLTIVTALSPLTSGYDDTMTQADIIDDGFNTPRASVQENADPNPNETISPALTHHRSFRV